MASEKLPTEAIVLAGGLGTRMSAVLPRLPKVMADVGGRPFLAFLLDSLSRNGIRRIVLATGHLHAHIERHFGDRRGDARIVYSVEDRPLGTGGAVWKALGCTSSEDVFVLNGDTFFDVDLQALADFHRSVNADITLALKPMRDFDRYGAVVVSGGLVTAFCEKRQTKEGLVNGGVYVVGRRLTQRLTVPGGFSLERDLLEAEVGSLHIGGYVSDGYFIDIGVPSDYERAQRELPGIS
jgi:D-glycero-alpha-D-manno-heptose 1-phosphate guanylyltransferase